MKPSRGRWRLWLVALCGTHFVGDSSRKRKSVGKRAAVLGSLLLLGALPGNGCAAGNPSHFGKDYVGRYTKEGHATDYVEIRSDGTFVVLEKGRKACGPHTIRHNKITLSLPMGTSVATLEPGRLIDDEGQVWVKTTGETVGLTDGCAIAGGHVVDVGPYTVQVPLGGDWTVHKDHALGTVAFRKTGPHGRSAEISAIAGFVYPGKENQPEEAIVTMILGHEEKNMRERGMTRSYTLHDVVRDVTTIAGKKLHVMSYTIADRSTRVPFEMKYAMYLYLPPDLPQKRAFYLFLIGDMYKFGGTVYETDLTQIRPVIESFQTK